MNRRILLIGSFAQGSLETSYTKAFERLGYEPFCFDSESFYRTGSALASHRMVRRALRGLLWARMNRTAVEVAACVRPQLVFAVKCCFLEPGTVRLLRSRLGVPVANYYPDHPYCGVPLDPRSGASAQRRNLMHAFREYSTVWVWENSIAGRLRRDGVEAQYLPFGVDRDLLASASPDPAASLPKTCANCRTDHRVVFIGHFNGKRGRHVEQITKHAVALWGSGWQRMGRRACSRHHIHDQAIAGLGMAAVYARAAVSLNIVGDLNIPGHNMRTFEIPASGGVMLSHYTEEQAAFFPENQAAAYYRTPEDLDQKIDELLADPDMTQRLRRNAVLLAKEHCYEQRANAVLRHFGLPGAAC